MWSYLLTLAQRHNPQPKTMTATNQENTLQALWATASNQGNTRALAHLRDAFEANALDETRDAERAANKARHAMGSKYFTKGGKRRTCDGRPVFSHTGSFHADSYACSLDDSELTRALRALPGILADLRSRRPAGWGTTQRNLLRDQKAYRGEARRRGL